MKIEALHEFHDANFSREWAEKFKPTPARSKLFETILRQIEKAGHETTSVLELGIGPGFLASFLLNRMPQIAYEGLDYSKSMLRIATERTEAYKERIIFTQADLINEAWENRLKRLSNVIVSTWALHDLFEKKNILNVYKTAYEIMPEGGLLLNGDFIKPEESSYEYEGGRIKPSEHLELLRTAGFQNPRCVEEFEKSIEHPTTSNNYALFTAEK